MRKRERIEVLEREVADLKARLASVEARPQWVWTQPSPTTPAVMSPFSVGDAPPPPLAPDITWTTSRGGSQ